jgi:hypothetical protein
MKTILILITLLMGCNFVQKTPIPVKPFIVYGKDFPYRGFEMCRYTCVDNNGYHFDFSDRSELYHIGDTIK